eukprot:gnl/TRDRNA2_/TRDRNA2_78251_c0_seq1.p1 gnl/TRDRNA2_/TRDRNA2_78251_c0~~gnl/TRDRNA2_/TRDRNA2_78251_c0_seq1.p1  ORF type:complete len:246 (-),score=37.75 gnl/TRDRNA2_/TRDRNA2_78251_c0_seq1:31-702(-)
MMEWSDGVCDCQSDCGSCWLTCCCPCITQMQNINKLPGGYVPFFGSGCKINGVVYLVIFFLMCAAGGTISSISQANTQNCIKEKGFAQNVGAEQAVVEDEIVAAQVGANTPAPIATPQGKPSFSDHMSDHMTKVMECMHNESPTMQAAETLIGVLDAIFTMGVFMGIVQALKIDEGPCTTCFKACCCWCCYICQVHRHLDHHEGYSEAEEGLEMVGGPVSPRA